MIRIPASFGVPVVTREGDSGVAGVFFPKAAYRGDDALRNSWCYAVSGYAPFPNLPILFKTPELRISWSFPLMAPYYGFSSFVAKEILEKGFVSSFDESVQSCPEFRTADRGRRAFAHALIYALLEYFPTPAKGDKMFERVSCQQHRSARELLKFQGEQVLRVHEQMELLCIGNAIDKMIGYEFDVEPGARVHITRYDRDQLIFSSDCLDMLKRSVLQEIQKVVKSCDTIPRYLSDKIDRIAPHLEKRIRMEAFYFAPLKQAPPAKGSES